MFSIRWSTRRRLIRTSSCSSHRIVVVFQFTHIAKQSTFFNWSTPQNKNEWSYISRRRGLNLRPSSFTIRLRPLGHRRPTCFPDLKSWQGIYLHKKIIDVFCNNTTFNHLALKNGIFCGAIVVPRAMAGSHFIIVKLQKKENSAQNIVFSLTW